MKTNLDMESLIILLLILIVWLFQSQIYRLKGKSKIPDEILRRLEELGKEALTSEDVPVGAILTYKNKIIGEGYNTVNKCNKLSGHAELNALNMAFENLGMAFFKLEKNKLILYSSYEPCEMCKGALLHYNIRHIFFEGKKTLGEHLISQFKGVLYSIFKKQINAPKMQENLFLKHPGYRQHHGLD